MLAVLKMATVAVVLWSGAMAVYDLPLRKLVAAVLSTNLHVAGRGRRKDAIRPPPCHLGPGVLSPGGCGPSKPRGLAPSRSLNHAQPAPCVGASGRHSQRIPGRRTV